MCGTVLFVALLALNVPFYAGSGGAHWVWRMEHGRILVQHRSDGVNEHHFYVDLNSEGLRFSPECRFHNLRNWMINVPIWAFVLPCVGLAVLGRTRPRQTPGVP